MKQRDKPARCGPEEWDRNSKRWRRVGLMTLAFAAPILAQTSPWETAVQNLQVSFTGPIAKGLSLVALVVGGLMFAYSGRGCSRKRSEVKGQITMSEPAWSPVYKAINKPLTVWGVERRLFFVAMVMGSATFTCFSSVVGAALMFTLLYALARYATRVDAQILRILMNSSRFRVQYDPLKRDFYPVERIANGQTVSDY
jgi:type IV secretory pathway VirB3-like protein